MPGLRRYDVSVPIREGMPVYPGNPAPKLDLALAIAAGDPANITRVDFGAHTGTHLDAPVHFLDGAPGAETIPLEPLIGPCLVLDLLAVAQGDITARDLEEAGLTSPTERVLLKTRNSALWAHDAFAEDATKLDPGAAQAIVDAGVRLVGIDYLSIGGPEAHRTLLRAGVVPLEGVDLRAVPAGTYRLLCLPLPIVGCDGAPARAILETL